MGSYNYLGFAECEGPCATAAQKTTRNLGLGACSSRQELGIENLLLFNFETLIYLIHLSFKVPCLFIKN